MKRIYRQRKSADNEYTALTGIMAFKMNGGSNCLLIRFGSKKKQKDAFSMYRDEFYKLNRNIKVTSTCGVLNCVKKDHLVAKYYPSKKEKEYIEIYGKEVASNSLNVPIEML